MIELDDVYGPLGDRICDLVCREERCCRLDLHLSGECRQTQGALCDVKIPGRKSALTEVVFDVIRRSRYPKFFRQIFDAVLRDYGAISQRNVHRALKSLIDRNQILCFSGYGLYVYVRPDSPLASFNKAIDFAVGNEWAEA